MIDLIPKLRDGTVRYSSVKRLDDLMLDACTEWHMIPGKELHPYYIYQYLGMTVKEYMRWFEDPTTLIKIIGKP